MQYEQNAGSGSTGNSWMSNFHHGEYKKQRDTHFSQANVSAAGQQWQSVTVSPR